mgnify:CR=1 FL=1
MKKEFKPPRELLDAFLKPLTEATPEELLDKGTRAQRENEIYDKIYPMLFHVFTNKKGESLNMTEAAALREIVRDTISNTRVKDLDKTLGIQADAQERFLNYVGIGSLGIDPAYTGGLDLQRDEIRALWKKYDKDRKGIIDDSDVQAEIDKM